MLEYDRNEVSQGIDINKTDGSHYLYFLNLNFRFQPEVCNDCHELVQKAMNSNDVAIVNVKEKDF